MRIRNTVFGTSRAALVGAFAAFLLVWLEALPGYAAAVLTTHVPRIVFERQAPVVGNPDPSTRLQLAISLPLRNQGAMRALLRAIYDRSNPQYRHYLTVAEFTARFGPSADDYNKVVQFFKSSDLRVTALSASRYLVDVNGSVADVERVFHVKIHLYKHPTQNRSFFAPDREPTLDLAVPVLHATGLDNFVVPSSGLSEQKLQNANTFRPELKGRGLLLSGSLLRAAYADKVTLTGTGQSVGLIDPYGINLSDVRKYFSKYGPDQNVPIYRISADNVTPIDCSQPTCPSDTEQAVDVEYAVSMAPGLQQVRIYIAANSLNSPVDALTLAANDDICQQISTSFHWGENSSTENQIFAQMAVQGQAMFVASGDKSSLAKSGPWPAEDAFVTAVGGTNLATAGGTYGSETGWYHSGGGPSYDPNILIPTYQYPFINGSNKGSYTLRNVPDVSAAANNLLYCGDGACGYASGTSFAAPMWAGFLALANEEAAQNGNAPIGSLNPAIYDLANGIYYQTLFHDVSGGTSGEYSAVPGYDLVTGLGSPNGQPLIDALANYVPFSLTSQPTTFESTHGVVSSSTATITLSSKSSFSAAATLTNGSGPCGTNGITCTFADTSITPPANASATTTLNIQTSTSTPAGTYAIPVIATFPTWKSSVNNSTSTNVLLSVESKPLFAVRADPSTIFGKFGTATTGARSSIIVKSENGFSAPVTLTLSGPCGTYGITCRLNRSPVTPPLGASISSDLILSTTAKTPAGNYQIVVTATDPLQIQTTSVTVDLDVEGGDFSLESNTTDTGAGMNYPYGVTAYIWDGFSGTIQLKAHTTSPISCTLDRNTYPASLLLSGTATAPGVFTCYVTGTSGNLPPRTLSYSAFYAVNGDDISGAGQIGFSVFKSPQTQSSPASFVTYDSTPQTVKLTVGGDCGFNGITCSFHPSTLILPAATIPGFAGKPVYTTLTVTTTSQTPALGNFFIIPIASSGGTEVWAAPIGLSVDYPH